MAPQVFPVVLCDVNRYLSTGEIEYPLLRLRGEELHVVRRSHLAEYVSVVEDGLVQNVVIFACPL